MTTFCYHELTYHGINSLLAQKDRNPISHNQLVQDVISDIFGEGHIGHTEPIIGYWDWDSKFYSIQSLLREYQVESDDFIFAILSTLIADPTGYWHTIEFYMLLAEQEHLSKRTLLALMDWIRKSDPFNLLINDDETEAVRAIFQHPNFPQEVLVSYCSDPLLIIRRLASQSPRCPEEGRVIATLFGKR